MGDCAFIVAGPCLWNKLPESLFWRHTTLTLLFTIYNIFFISFGLKDFTVKYLWVALSVRTLKEMYNIIIITVLVVKSFCLKTVVVFISSYLCMHVSGHTCSSHLSVLVNSFTAIPKSQFEDYVYRKSNIDLEFSVSILSLERNATLIRWPC